MTFQGFSGIPCLTKTPMSPRNLRNSIVLSTLKINILGFKGEITNSRKVKTSMKASMFQAKCKSPVWDIQFPPALHFL